jgi:microcystin-dependent protein
MSSPYIGEIRMFGGNFAPAGWAFCDGSLVAISQNDALFNLIGTTYGGDGQATFALPDLRGRLPLHQGQGTGLSNYTLGETGGVEQVTLTVNQIPVHNHALNAASTGQVLSPLNALPAVATSTQTGVEVYGPVAANPTTFNNQTIAADGGSQPHSNFQPYLCVDFIISLFGIFPSQN